METLITTAIVSLVASHIALIVVVAKHTIHIDNIFKILERRKIL